MQIGNPLEISVVLEEFLKRVNYKVSSLFIFKKSGLE